MPIVVIKFGGSALEVPQAAANFAKSVVEIKKNGFTPIVVHGGGKSLSKWMEKVNLTPRFVEGLRFTDEATLELAQMVLSGKANKDLVALINSAGGNAVGLSGTDGPTFIPHQIKSPSGADIGFVGEISSIDTWVLGNLLDNIPVVCSIGHTEAGQALNVNADHVAAEIARAMQVQDLVLLTDVDGILIDGVLQKELSFKEAKALLSHKSVSGGMRPKIEYALRALGGGVERAHIVNAALPDVVSNLLFAKTQAGTTIYGDERQL
jgi:acetylglutamate kinase